MRSAALPAPGGTVRLDVIFLETPHRLALEIDPPAGCASTCWMKMPLVLGTPTALLTLHEPW